MRGSNSDISGADIVTHFRAPSGRDTSGGPGRQCTVDEWGIWIQILRKSWKSVPNSRYKHLTASRPRRTSDDVKLIGNDIGSFATRLLALRVRASCDAQSSVTPALHGRPRPCRHG